MPPAAAQATPFVGVQAGISALSSDSQAVPTPQGLSTSLYTPANGPSVNVLGGVHLNNYVSLQGNFIWSQNDLLLSSSSSQNSFYQQRRTSSQESFIADFLLYFRRLDSRFRPYLSVGAGVAHFSSTEQQLLSSGGTPVLPLSRFSSTRPLLHVPVGIDVGLSHRLAFRYSFSETIRHNDISDNLAPPGRRSLATFQNLFGIVLRF